MHSFYMAFVTSLVGFLLAIALSLIAWVLIPDTNGNCNVTSHTNRAILIVCAIVSVGLLIFMFCNL